MRSSFLSTIIKYLIYVSAFVPLIIFSQFLSPFHFGKVVVFRSLVEIMAVFYFILVLKDRSFLPPWRHPIFISFAIFVFVFGITTLSSVNTYVSFWGTLERMGGFWSFLHYFAFFVISVSVLRSKNEWRTLMKLIAVVGLLSALYGLGQKTDYEFIIGSGGRARIFGTIGNPALFAGYQILAFFVAFALGFLSSRKSFGRKLWFSFAIISFLAVMMTAVRGSILGIGIGLLVFVLLYWLKFKSRNAKIILLVFLSAILMFVLSSFALKNTSLVKNSGYLKRITDLSLSSYTVQTRFWAWQAGLKGWDDSIKTVSLGWGPENFNIPFSKNFNPKFFRSLSSETLFDRAHNMFVEVLVTMGIVGFLSYLALLIAAIISVKRKLLKNHDGRLPEEKSQRQTQELGDFFENRMWGVILLPMLIAYIIHNSFIFDTSANFLVFFSILGFIVWLTKPIKNEHLSGGQFPDSHVRSQKRLGVPAIFLTGLLLAGVCVIVYRTNIVPAKANYTATRAIIKSWRGDFDGAVEKFKEALVFDVPGKYDFRHRAAQYILDATNGKKLEAKDEEALLFMVGEIQKNIDESPQDYLPLLYLSRIYIVLGKNDAPSHYNDLALESSLKALKISPTFVRTYYEVAQAYLNKKDYEKAAFYFEEVVKLNPEVGTSQWYLGATLAHLGDFENAFAAIEKAKELYYPVSDSDIQRILNLAIQSNNFKNIVGAYKLMAEITPDDPQVYASMAVALAKIGDIDGAVEAARRAVELDPSFEAEARSFVQSLGRKF